MFHLAHISDIHLAPLPEPSWGELCNKRITGYLNWKKHRQSAMDNHTLPTLMKHLHGQNPDHLVISGDLVNLSLDREFSNARRWIEEQSVHCNISTIFGNHDAYIPGAFNKACHIFSPWIKSDRINEKSSTFPYMQVHDQVAIIGCSSAIATPPFCAAGYFDRQQAIHLGRLLDAAKAQNLFRVIMIHHPPLYHATYFHKKLIGIGRFQDIIHRYGAELVLHGHTHLPTLNFMQGKTNKIPVVGVASASQAFGGKKPPANYNLFHIENKDTDWYVKLERYTVTDKNNTIALSEQIEFIQPFDH